MPNQQEMFGHNAMFSSVTFRSIMIEFSNVIYLAQIFSLYIYIYINIHIHIYTYIYIYMYIYMLVLLLTRYLQILVFSITFGCLDLGWSQF